MLGNKKTWDPKLDAETVLKDLMRETSDQVHESKLKISKLAPKTSKTSNFTEHKRQLDQFISYLYLHCVLYLYYVYRIKYESILHFMQ